MPKMFVLAPYLPPERMQCTCSVCRFSVSMFKLLQVLGLNTFIVFPCLKQPIAFNFNFDLLRFSQGVYERYLTYGNLSYDLLSDSDFLGIVNFRCLSDRIFCLREGFHCSLNYSELNYQNMLLSMSNFSFSIIDGDGDEQVATSPLDVFKVCFSGFEKSTPLSAEVCGDYAVLSRFGLVISHYDHFEIRILSDELKRLVDNLSIFSNCKPRRFVAIKSGIRKFLSSRVNKQMKPIGTGNEIRSFRLSVSQSERMIRLNLDKYPP